MKIDREIIYRCDECRREITNRKHLRLLIGFTSGLMVPPFIGGKPEISMIDRNPEFHYCKPACALISLEKKINEVYTRSAQGGDLRPAPTRLLLTEAGAEGSYLRRPHHMGARAHLRREADKRSVGDSGALREGAFSGSIPGYGDHGENDFRMDSDQSDEPGGRREVPEIQLGATARLSEFFVRAITATKKAAYSVMP